MKNVVCFGEILWDNFPSGSVPGGAPMNVAYHLNKLGIAAALISRVGHDEKGDALKVFLKEKGISENLLQLDAGSSTGVVNVAFKNGEPEYDIVFPSAWDYIAVSSDTVRAVEQADAFVFGSLSARNEVSRYTLGTLLSIATYKVMDVNFRFPYVSQLLVEELIVQADLVKMNAGELMEIYGWIGGRETVEDAMAQAVMQKFMIRELILTKGSQGAAYYSGKDKFSVAAPVVKIADTVGSGDSFLAGFLFCKLSGHSPLAALQFAAALAALITTLNGACPDYHLEEIKKIETDRKA